MIYIVVQLYFHTLIMNCYCFLIFIVLTNIFAFNKTNGQTLSSSEPSSFKNIKAYFKNEIGENVHLYSGKEYTGYERNIKGDPFFVSSEMQNSDIFYNGTLYENVPLLFDIVRQEIVINRYNQNFRIKLLNEKIKYFTLSGHKFENIPVTEKDGNTGYGIYDMAFDGKASLLVKRFKRIVNGLKAEDQPRFVQEDEFFIRNSNSFYAVDDRSSLLLALNDKKELIKTYIRKNKFRFKKNIEKEFILTTAYYSTLNK